MRSGDSEARASTASRSRRSTCEERARREVKTLECLRRHMMHGYSDGRDCQGPRQTARAAWTRNASSAGGKTRARARICVLSRVHYPDVCRVASLQRRTSTTVSLLGSDGRRGREIGDDEQTVVLAVAAEVRDRRVRVRQSHRLPNLTERALEVGELGEFFPRRVLLSLEHVRDARTAERGRFLRRADQRAIALDGRLNDQSRRFARRSTA